MQTSGDIYIGENAKAEFPALQTSGDIIIRQNAKAEFPALQTSGYIYIGENAKAEFPALQTSGDIYIGENAKAEFGKIICVNDNEVEIKNKKYKIVHYDNIPFIIENSKKSKGIKIHSGILILSLEDGKATINQRGFLVEKDGYYAHGRSIKAAISDLQFKIGCEKLKNEPISYDTEITVQHYRMITGACQMGCEMFMEEHNLKEPMKAGDLLHLLEKSNAYGVSRFKELLNKTKC